MASRRWITVTKASSLIYWSCPGGCKQILWSDTIPIGKVCFKCQLNYIAIQLFNNRLLIEVHYEDNNK